MSDHLRSAHLSKSDFKIGRTCPTKLYYRKKGYPSATDHDAYLKLLAEGGYMVEEIARLLHPAGVEVAHAGGTAEAIAQTERLLAGGHTELFEPTFVHDGRLVRIDVLRLMPRTRTIELIEVKAKSWDSSLVERPFQTKRGGPGIRAEWDEYIADVAFQTLVLRDVFPDYDIIPYLMMPDKAKTTSIDLLYRHFRVHRQDVPRPDGRTFTTYDISFTGDAAALRRDHFLAKVNVEEEVAIVEEDVGQATQLLSRSLQPALVRVRAPLGAHCSGCEFQTTPYAESGFGQCWGALGAHDHHIFDLRRGTQIPGVDGALFDEMIARGETSLFDVDEARVCGKNGTVGTRNVRQLIQLRHTRQGTEFVDAALGRELMSAAGPLHFIDFETSSLAVPYHAGMRPYESIAFQWSCHTVADVGACAAGPTDWLDHAAWLHGEADASFPNFEFARTLRAQIGDTGTVFIWSHHERTILGHIQRQIREGQVVSAAGRELADLADLAAWIGALLASDRIVDMEKLCEQYYFHPLMKGKTSIKNVCDAIWQTNAAVRAAFPDYIVPDGRGGYLSPYAGLPPARFGDVEFDVAVGTDAVRAYESTMFGLHRDDADARAAIRKALLRYCELDTAAMVMIWQHWTQEGRG